MGVPGLLLEGVQRWSRIYNKEVSTIDEAMSETHNICMEKLGKEDAGFYVSDEITEEDIRYVFEG